MNLVDEAVQHKVFGEGQVVEQSDTSITVAFDDEHKRFVYPDSLKTFLILKDRDLAERLGAALSERKEREEILEERRAKEEEREALERERQARLKSNKIHESSQIVFWLEEDETEDVLEKWEAFTGTVQSGKSAGEPNRAARLRPNSAAVLTVRHEDEEEIDRRVIGLYMVPDTFYGNETNDGIVPAHETYRIPLTEEEADSVFFWDYYMNRRYPDRATWNSGVYRYFDNVWTAQLLKDVYALKTDETERERVKQFYDYFCRVNLLDPASIPEREGTRTRMSS